MRFIKSTEYREFILKMFVLAIGLCFLLLTIGCPKTDDPTTEIAPFISSDFTELDKITAISYFRSGCGHDYSDDFETNRSMKHYYEPFGAHRVNDDVKIFSPVDGQITEIVNEEHGSSVGLKNKQIRIRPSAHHELTIIIFHSDLISAEIIVGKLVTAGEHLAYAHMYYDDIPEYAHDFDIAVRQDVGNGKKRYLSYIELMNG